MVKNNGGNKAKKFASKSFNISDRATRYAIETDEIYAIVTKMLGGTNCEVLCIDGKTRQCVIRNKFCGKGKRDNWLTRGKWILVGLRNWEVTTKVKEKCDLLEVYNDNDKDKLIRNSKENFRIFLSVVTDELNMNDDQIDFINTKEQEEEQEEEEEEEELFHKQNEHYQDSNNSDDEDEDEDEGEKGNSDNGMNKVNDWYYNYSGELDTQDFHNNIITKIDKINIDDI